MAMASNGNELHVETVQVGNIRMRVAVQGRGPLVLMCHGFPESWISWRHQMQALSAAGYRVVAPDMRGYGGTDAPPDPDSYTMLHHVGDMVELARQYGTDGTAPVIVGHDWGAPVAWNAALLRPDLFRGVVGMSVPFVPPSPIDLLSALELGGIKTFYMQYFQTPGVAEAELEADPEATIRRIWYSMSGDGPGRTVAGIMSPGAGFLDATVEPDSLPDWLKAEDIAYVSTEFRRTGFRGGLNWYRTVRRTSELLAPWRGAVITLPSLFVAGARDDVLRFPGMDARVKQLQSVLPGLRGSRILDGAGHWIQRERPAEISDLLLKFLAGL
jgi:pimeloyl-ACP methyl ester carboxylesterase